MMLQFRTNALIKKDKSARHSMRYDESKHMGILYTAEDLKKHDSIKKLKKSLERDGKKVEVLSFLPKDTQNFEFRFNFFTAKHLNMWGKITSKDVAAFADRSFDYLFYVDFESTSILRYILAMSKAHCRIGNFEEVNRPFCELMVAPELTSYNSLVDEMYKYTKILT